MTRLPKVRHILDSEGQKYSFMAADIYASVGAGIGVTKAPENDNTTYAGRLSPDSFANGLAIRIKALGKAIGQPNKDFTFIVSFDKAQEALANIGSKTVAVDSVTYKLGEARIPSRRRFS